MSKTTAQQKADLLERSKLYQKAIDMQLDESIRKAKLTGRNVAIVGGIVFFFYGLSRFMGSSKNERKTEASSPPPEKIYIPREEPPAKAKESGLSQMLKEGLASVVLTIFKQFAAELMVRAKETVFSTFKQKK